MATQFPNDPNADRFIDGLKMTDDGGAVAEVLDILTFERFAKHLWEVK